MNIIVCYKIVPEEQDISVGSDGALVLDKAEAKISQYDLNAVEAGNDLVAQTGGTLRALTVGGAKKLENTKIRKDILSRGPEALTQVVDERFEGAQPFETAAALAGAARSMGFDLIVCGEGSGDRYAQQVGLLAGEMLEVPTINAVSKISPGEGVVVVERSLENEVEVLELTLPAVLSVTTDINTPKIPSMKAILAAGKKPVTVLSAEDIGYGDEAHPASMISIKAPKKKDRQNIIFESDSDENIAALAEHIRKAVA